jgi:hypothetical protein
MSAYQEKGFADRLSASARAKASMAERFKAQPAPDHPDVLDRRARQRVVTKAREERAAAKQAEREAELARMAEDETRRTAQELAREAEAEQREAELAAQRETQLTVQRKAESDGKAARDARYAARKARK